MENKGIIIAIILILVIGGFFYFQSKTPTACTMEAKQCPDGSYVSRVAPNCEFAECGSGELTRIVPSSVSPNSQFTVTYSSNRQGKYGVIIVDSVSGGCKFQSGKTEYKNVIISENGPTSETVSVTAPSSGSCIFSGDYNYNIPIIKFPDQTVQIQ